jgi:putative membrane-bound dehydrogenase-like protein
LLTQVKLKEMLPRLDPLPPAEALKAFRIEKGFRVELVACEPDVVDPIALAFDEDGRLFVAEDIDYPESPKPGKKALGRIRMLVDKDGDGRYETSTIFADNLQWPSGIAVYKGGIFVSAPPRIWYLKDTDGDGKADVRRVVFDGFGTASAEDIMNNLKWGLDNQIYGASSYNGGDVFHANKKEKVSLRGRDFRFDPVTEKLEPLAGTGDFGNCFDDWGNRFVSNAGMLLIHNVLPGHYLARNPHLLVREVNYRSAASKKTMASISPPEPWRVVRKKFWDKWVNTTPDMRASRFSVAELAERGFVTGGAGCEIYRGAAFPGEYHGNSFTAEPAGNVVIRLKLNPNGVTFDAKAVNEKQEFLASTDNWFRPVNITNGPDGCLYVCDMSREIIEDPSAIPEDILKIVDVTRGRDRGRIYRIVPEGFKRPAAPQLSKASTKELVALLERPDAWWRETAQRLLLERQDKSAVEPLRALVRHAKLPQARLHALWILHGLKSLDDDLLLFALSDSHAAIREHGARLAEVRLAESPRVRKQFLMLAADKEPRVRLQVAFSLGAIADREEAAEALATILLRDSEDKWMRSAVLSSVGERPVALYMDLLRRPAEGTLLETLLPPLAEQVAARGGADVRRVLGSLTQPALRASPKATEAVLLALADRLALSSVPITEMLKDPTPINVRELFEASLSQAAKTAGNGKSPMPDRLRAIRLLRHAPIKQVDTVLASLISIEHPPEIQLAGIQAFAGKIEGKTAGLLLERWRGSGPQVRPEIVEVLLGQSEGVIKLIEALEKKSIAAGELSPLHRDILMKKAGPALRERTSKLFTASATASRKQVLDKYQAALKLTGDTVRGRQIFTMHCATCHRLGDVGKAVGPDLLASKDKTPDALLIAILDPSREVSANFVNYVVTTKNGQTLTGMLAGESSTTITLRRAEGAEDIVARADIEEFASTRLSLMPEGLEDRIDVQQMADLLRFLTERK